MTGRLEDRIRDYLAVHLDLLEAGLSLFEKEYAVPNARGAGGRIDLVAKDRFGQFVVIEIKRSDTSARQALHEIHKYTGLFRVAHGLDVQSVRVVVVSTDWDELLVPLSECLRSFPYSVEGFRIDVDSDGAVLRAERVTLLRMDSGIRFSREQAAYLFRDQEKRDTSESALAAAAQSAGLRDFVILALDHIGADAGVIYPFALYLVFASPLADLTPEEFLALQADIGWDDELGAPDENFLLAIGRTWGNRAEAFEIGYPAKLTNMRADWRTVVSLRAGRLARTSSPLGDADILSLAQEISGGSGVYLYRVTSPRFKAAWTQLRRDAQEVLLGLTHWETIVTALLTEVENRASRATVSIALYNPANLLVSLYYVAAFGDYAHFPQLEVVVEPEESSDLQIVAGALAWGGAQVTVSPEELVSRLYGGVDEWMMAQHFHQTFEVETAAVVAHNLEAIAVEFRTLNGDELPPALLSTADATLRRGPFLSKEFGNLAEFAQANRAYLEDLKRFIETHMVGLRPASEEGSGPV